MSGIDLWLSDTIVPQGNRAFSQHQWQLFVNPRTSPDIRTQTFFKGGDKEIYFYASSDTTVDGVQTLQNVKIYDQTNDIQLPTSGGPFPKFIVAQTAQWVGSQWILNNGVIYNFDRFGLITEMVKFEEQIIDLSQTQLVSFSSTQKRPDEMNLGELSAHIAKLGGAGLTNDKLVVDFHLKIAIPLMCLIVALFGAPLALLIGTRGRAIGIILAVLLVLVYQGLLFWTAQILGYRGDINPVLGAWLPNMLFGLIGIYFVFITNRFGRLDLLAKLKRIIPIVVLVGASFTASASEHVQEFDSPIGTIESDLAIMADDLSVLHFLGNVRASYGDGFIEAEELELLQLSEDSWELNALDAVFSAEEVSGRGDILKGNFARINEIVTPQSITLTQSASVEFTRGTIRAQKLELIHGTENSWRVSAEEEVQLELLEQDHHVSADLLQLRLEGEIEDPSSVVAHDAVAEGVLGETDFTNAGGKGQRLRYKAELAELFFDEENELSDLDLKAVQFTTCTCHEQIEDADYSIKAQKLLVKPDLVLAAFGITFRLFGQPILWAPAYVAPLGDLEQRYPFLPEIGRDRTRGFFAKWRLPIFLDERTFGHLILEYYSKFTEIGTGIDLNYRLVEGSSGGRFSFYRLVGLGDSYSVDWRDAFKLNETTSLSLAAGLRSGLLQEVSARLLTGAVLTGREGDWGWNLSFNRDQNLVASDASEEELAGLQYLLLERFPELGVTRPGIELHQSLPVKFTGNLQWGRYREEAIDGQMSESSRLDGGLSAAIDPIRISECNILEEITDKSEIDDENSDSSDAEDLGEGAQDEPRSAQQRQAECGSLTAGVGYRITNYDQTRRESWDLTSGINLRFFNALNVAANYSWRQIKGSSPFQFDQLQTSNAMSLRADARLTQSAQLQMNSGYDWIQKLFGPVRMGFLYADEIIRVELAGEHDLNQSLFKGVVASANLTTQSAVISLQTGYSFERSSYNDLIARFDFGPEFQVGIRFNMNQFVFSRANFQSSLNLGRWDVTLGAEIDIPNLRLSASQFSFVRNFCNNCWQLGISGNQNQIVFQARITAFPTAGVQYSPTDQSLSFGR